MIRLLDGTDFDGIYLRHSYTAWPSENRYWIGHGRQWECTAILRKEKMPRYPSKAKGEDTVMIKQLYLRAIKDAPHLYIRVVHGNNTWPRRHFEAHYRRRERLCTEQETQEIIRELNQ